MRLRLRFVLADRRRPLDLELHVRDPEATVADLLFAVAPHLPPGPVAIGSRTILPGTPLRVAGFVDGDEVSVEPPPRESATDGPRPAGVGAGRASGVPLALVVETGFDCGRSTTRTAAAAPLSIWRPAGTVPRPDADLRGPCVGELPINDPTISRRPVSVRLPAEAVAEGSTVVRLGAATIVARPPLPPSPPAPHPGPATTTTSARSPETPPTVPVHRTPRPQPVDPLPPVAPPGPPEEAPPSAPIGIAALVAAPLGALAMVAITGSRTYALLALLGPLAMGAQAVDAWRVRRRHRRRAERIRREVLDAFEQQVTDRARSAVEDRAEQVPGPAVLIHRVLADPTRWWERRGFDPDAHVVGIGRGIAPWPPPVAAGGSPLGGDVGSIVAHHADLQDVAISLPLAAGRPIALVGPSAATRSLARSMLVQAAILHGPADLAVALVTDSATDPEASEAWRWLSWLPHRTGDDGEDLLADSGDGCAALVDRLVGRPSDAIEDGPPRRRTVVVVDDPAGLRRTRGPLHRLLRHADGRDGRAAATDLVPVVLVETRSQVPAVCRSVVAVDADGTLHAPRDLAVGPALATGVGLDVAEGIARLAAGLADPEVDGRGAGLPVAVRLADLGPTAAHDHAEGLRASWRTGGANAAPIATIGATTSGPLEIDLAADGPHALIAGTTGAGKSELLRTLVASLAARCSPEALTFVLIDFKGGAAFDACARLPHVVGVVTDLDPHLATRVLRGLRAELRRREELLREAGATDLAGWQADRHGPLPRLAIVVDEFATLRAELPEFVDDLVSVAERGRSLGLHLVLATQRPSGAISDRIRANTELRICLRVADRSDSIDVLGDPSAAGLPRTRPGRGVVRLDHTELVAFQTAQVSGPAADRPSVEVGPLHGWIQRRTPELGSERAVPPTGDPTTPTDLVRLVEAAEQAWAHEGGAQPHRPWPDPLPARVRLGDLPAPPVGTVAIGLADDPDRQRHALHSWCPSGGALLVVGLAGSGTSSTALAATVGLSASADPRRLHVHAIDHGGALEVLRGLPHVGDVVGGDDVERQRRLLLDLRRDLEERRTPAPRRRPSGDATRPERLLVVDGVGAMRARWADRPDPGPWEAFVDLLRHGSGVGIHVIATATGPSDLPHQVLAACPQRLVHRLADAASAGALGADAQVPALPAGRAVAVPDGVVVQVAVADAALIAAMRVRHPTSSDRGARPVAVLPHRLELADLVRRRRPADVPRSPAAGHQLLIGVDEGRLRPTSLLLEPGGHALVAGPPRSGRTAALAVLAASARANGLAVRWVDGRRDRALDEGPPPSGPAIVLVDDADLTGADGGWVGEALQREPALVTVVAAVRSDRARSSFAHWTRRLRAHRCGLLLCPDLDLDGELLGTRLPRRLPLPARPGLAWAVDRSSDRLVQVALAPPPSHLSSNP